MIVPKRQKVIVIGSGAAGMTAAIICAREGHDVTVLEQHAVPGGLMQTYWRRARRFPTGVHCLGALDTGQILWRYLKYLGVLDRLDLKPMPDDCIAEFRFPGLTFRMPRGHARFEQRLLEHFPTEADAVRRYVRDMRQCTQLFPLYNCRHEPAETIPRRFMRPLKQYIDERTDNEALKSVLTGNVMLYGIEPSVCPLFIPLLISDSFLQSSYRVDESQNTLAGAFVAALEAHGGKVRCRARVEEILAEGQTVSGVRVDGETLPADIVVYTGHPMLLPQLCDPSMFRRSFRSRLEGLENTIGAFGLAAMWEHIDCPPAEHDVYIHAALDTEAGFRQRLTERPSAPAIVYCSAHKIEDGRFALNAMTPMQPDEVAAWTQSRHGKRPPSYYEAKANVAALIHQSVVRTWPYVDGRLSIVDSYTPLTYRDYTLTPDGSAYGVKRSTAALGGGRVMPVTKVRNLFLAGQSIVLSGVLGAVVSGVLIGTLLFGGPYLISRIRAETT